MQRFVLFKHCALQIGAIRSTNKIVLACWNFVLVVVTVIVSDCAVLDYNILPTPHQWLIGTAYPAPKKLHNHASPCSKVAVHCVQNSTRMQFECIAQPCSPQLKPNWSLASYYPRSKHQNISIPMAGGHNKIKYDAILHKMQFGRIY